MGWGLEAAEAEVVLEEQDVPENRRSEEKGVDAVEDATVAGQHGSGVLDACATLDGGLKEVAELGGYVKDCGEEERLPERFRDVKDGVAVGSEGVGDDDHDASGDYAAGDGGDRPRPCFTRT